MFFPFFGKASSFVLRMVRARGTTSRSNDNEAGILGKRLLEKTMKEIVTPAVLANIVAILEAAVVRAKELGDRRVTPEEFGATAPSLDVVNTLLEGAPGRMKGAFAPLITWTWAGNKAVKIEAGQLVPGLEAGLETAKRLAAKADAARPRVEATKKEKAPEGPSYESWRKTQIERQVANQTTARKAGVRTTWVPIPAAPHGVDRADIERRIAAEEAAIAAAANKPIVPKFIECLRAEIKRLGDARKRFRAEHGIELPGVMIPREADIQSDNRRLDAFNADIDAAIAAGEATVARRKAEAEAKAKRAAEAEAERAQKAAAYEAEYQGNLTETRALYEKARAKGMGSFWQMEAERPTRDQLAMVKTAVEAWNRNKGSKAAAPQPVSRPAPEAVPAPVRVPEPKTAPTSVPPVSVSATGPKAEAPATPVTAIRIENVTPGYETGVPFAQTPATETEVVLQYGRILRSMPRGVVIQGIPASVEGLLVREPDARKALREAYVIEARVCERATGPNGAQARAKARKIRAFLGNKATTPPPATASAAPAAPATSVAA